MNCKLMLIPVGILLLTGNCAPINPPLHSPTSNVSITVMPATATLSSLDAPYPTTIITPTTTSISLGQVHELATRYRDDWLTKNPSEETAILARGTIQSVERLTNGWHVVFITETGHDPNTPEGMHDYFLHVYLKLSGELERIERGPDVLS